MSRVPNGMPSLGVGVWPKLVGNIRDKKNAKAEQEAIRAFMGGSLFKTLDVRNDTAGRGPTGAWKLDANGITPMHIPSRIYMDITIRISYMSDYYRLSTRWEVGNGVSTISRASAVFERCARLWTKTTHIITAISGNRGVLGGEAADPDAFCGGLAYEYFFIGAIGDGDADGFVVFAVQDAQAGGGAETQGG